jgi:hypothetical protein
MADKSTSNKEKLEMIEERKKWAKSMSEGLNVLLNLKVETRTKIFKSAGEGFDIHIVNFTDADIPKVQHFLDKKGVEFGHGSNGNYTLLFPEDLVWKKIDPKDKVKLLEKQRDSMMRILSNNNLNYRGRGNAKFGCYTTNRIKAIMVNHTVEFYCTSETTAKQIRVALSKYYKGNTTIVIETVETTVKVAFLEDFFPKPVVPEIKPHAQNEAIISTTTATPVDEEEKKIEQLIALEQGQKAMTEHQLLKKTIFGVFGPEAGEKMLKLIIDKNFEITTSAFEGPDGNQRKVTRTLNAGDINEMLIKPWVESMKE